MPVIFPVNPSVLVFLKQHLAHDQPQTCICSQPSKHTDMYTHSLILSLEAIVQQLKEDHPGAWIPGLTSHVSPVTLLLLSEVVFSFLSSYSKR